jgi:UDP-N-acetyl-D-galactosamine dehydrogenase
LKTTNSIPKEKFDAIVLGVAHEEFLKLNFSEFTRIK